MKTSPKWLDAEGKALSCKEKIATLDDNLSELRDIALDALEDAAVMGVDLDAARKIFLEEIAALQPRFAGKSVKDSQESDLAGAVAQSMRSES